MKPETEFKNFIDHYGRQETFDAVAEVLLNMDNDTPSKVYREVFIREIVEFIEQVIFQHSLQDEVSL